MSTPIGSAPAVCFTQKGESSDSGGVRGFVSVSILLHQTPATQGEGRWLQRFRMYLSASFGPTAIPASFTPIVAASMHFSWLPKFHCQTAQ